MRKLYAAIFVVFLFICSSLGAQTLKQAIESLSGQMLSAYSGPAVNAFGVNMNGAWFNHAPDKEKLGLDIEFGFYAMGSKLGRDVTSFNYSTPFSFTKEQAVEFLKDNTDDPRILDQLAEMFSQQKFMLRVSGPTIISPSPAQIELEAGTNGVLTFEVQDENLPFPVMVEVDESEKASFELDGVLSNLEYLPYMAPQIRIGTIYATEAVMRWMPSINAGDEFGDIGMFGFGLVHNVGYWFEDGLLPFDVSVGFMTQQIDVGEIGEFYASSYGLNLSRKFDAAFISFTPYMSFMLESSGADFSYTREFETTYGSEEVTLHLEMDGDAKSRVSIGGVIGLGFFNINADYNIGKYDSFTGGFSFAF